MSKVLCSCSACKNESSATGGRFFHPSTVWRHRKKEQNLNINFSDKEEFLSPSSNNISDLILDNTPDINNLERYIIYFELPISFLFLTISFLKV